MEGSTRDAFSAQARERDVQDRSAHLLPVTTALMFEPEP